MSFVIPPRRAGKDFQDTAHGPDMAELAAREAEIAQRVKRELAKARGTAEAQGRDAGYADGFRAGKTQAETAMQSAAAALTAAATQLAAPLALKQADLAGLVAKLSRALAAHIIGHEAVTSPASITALAARLLAQAAAERQPKTHILLRLNPDDHAALCSLTLPPQTTLTPDAAIAQGGAILEIAAPETTRPATIWDATIQTRLATLA
jgi:flagellar assembly protein FliH